MRRRPDRLGVLIALVALALAMPAAAYPGANGRVAYESYGDGDGGS